MVMAVWKYGLDVTGKNPDNLVSGEIHTVPLDNKYAFATDYGPFYSDSVKITVKDTGVVLTQGTDYECLYLYVDAVQASGKPVTAVIHVLNKSINGDLLLDYQVVGGPYSSNAYALEELIALLGIDNRAVAWENIGNKPLVFPPAPHLHAATDLYGLEWVVDAINELTQAVLLGDVASHDQIYLRIATVKKQLQDNIDANQQANTARMDQIQADMESMDTRLTNAINALSSVVSAHINNKNNPHNVTVDQIQAVPTSRTINGKALTQNIVLSPSDVGSYSKAESDATTTALQNADAQLQTNISAVQNNLNVHAARTDNPHQVNWSQSGAVPQGRTINGKALTQDIYISAGDTGTYDAGTINNMINSTAVASLRWGGLNTIGKMGFLRWGASPRTPNGVITTIPDGGVCVQMYDAQIDSDWFLRDIDGVDWRYLQMYKNGTWYNVGL
jgi:hypothetical protein